MNTERRPGENTNSYTNQERGLGCFPCSETSKGVNPVNTLISESSTPEVRDHRFLLFRPEDV